jgi:predicted ATPase
MSCPGTRVIVVTGGPGGGKSSFLADIRRDAALGERVVILPEASRVIKNEVYYAITA